MGSGLVFAGSLAGASCERARSSRAPAPAVPKRPRSLFLRRMFLRPPFVRRESGGRGTLQIPPPALHEVRFPEPFQVDPPGGADPEGPQEQQGGQGIGGEQEREQEDAEVGFLSGE